MTGGEWPTDVSDETQHREQGKQEDNNYFRHENKILNYNPAIGHELARSKRTAVLQPDRR